MNKSLSVILATGFALFSCAKPDRQIGVEDLWGTGSQEGGFDYITAVGPGTPVKTVVNDGTKVLWTDGDEVGMYAEESATAVFSTILSEPSAKAGFGRISDDKPVKAGGLYYAVYPSSAVVRWTPQTDVGEQTAPFCYINVPKSQTAVKGSWDKKAAVLAASSEDETFTFRHAVSYLRFEVSEQTGDFVSVRLSSVNGEMVSDAQAGVKYLTENELGIVSGSAYAADYVTLRSPKNGVAFEDGTYYIALLPGTYADGLTLTFTDAEGLVAETSIGSVTLKPGEVVDWGAVGTLDFIKELTPLEIASVYMENGTSHGVVYYINPDDPYKGKIVSASSAEAMQWSDGLIWTEKILSQDDGFANYEQFNASTVYTSQKDRYYALKYCEDMRTRLGGNWYLPAPAELRTLFKVYYGLSSTPPATGANGTEYRFKDSALIQSAMVAKTKFDEALELLGETAAATLDGDADADGVCDDNGFGNADGVTYWTSKINTGGAVQYVNIGVYSVANIGKDFSRKYYVRCVRDVDMK